MNPYKVFTEPEQLYFLYESTISQIVKMRELMGANVENALNELYQLKLKEAETNLVQIKEVIQAKTQGECISIEQILMRNEGGQTAVSIWLKSETLSQSILGDTLQGHVLMSYEEMGKYIQNIQQQVHSYGNIRIQPIEPLNFDENQLNHMRKVGIETCEIQEVW